MVEEAGLFDFPKLEINKKIRLIELFGGEQFTVIQTGGKRNCKTGFNGYLFANEHKGCKAVERKRKLLQTIESRVKICSMGANNTK